MLTPLEQSSECVFFTLSDYVLSYVYRGGEGEQLFNSVEKSSHHYPVTYRTEGHYFFITAFRLCGHISISVLQQTLLSTATYSYVHSGCITTGRDWESHRAARNWPSIVRVWPV